MSAEPVAREQLGAALLREGNDRLEFADPEGDDFLLDLTTP